MSAPQNCTICQELLQEPLKSPSRFITETYSFPCTHKIHHTCFVKWADFMHGEQPELTTLNCPLCRHPTRLQKMHSAERISNWVKTARRLAITVSTILGFHIGRWFAGSSFAEEISQIALKTLHVSPFLAFSLAGGALAFLGSYFLIPLNSKSGLTRVITAIYNQVYGTEILPRDTWTYLSGFSSKPKEDQLQMVQKHFMEIETRTLVDQLELTPFNDEERQSLQVHISWIKNLQTGSYPLTERFFEYLAFNLGEVYAPVRRLNSQLLQSAGNGDLKRELSDLIYRWLWEVLAKVDKTSLDSKMAARITLIKALELFKKKTNSMNKHNPAQWKALLSSLQEKCRDPASNLINKLQQKMGPDFFKQCLPLLLWDPAIGDAVFEALTEIRKAQFERAGFFLKSK